MSATIEDVAREAGAGCWVMGDGEAIWNIEGEAANRPRSDPLTSITHHPSSITHHPQTRVIVTGGAGFIGSHIVDCLQAGGAEPIVLDDFSAGTWANVADGVEVIEADITRPDVGDLIAALKPDVIVHAAALVSVPRSMAEPELDRRINLIGAEQVIAGARRAGGCRVVYLSTGAGIYGEVVAPASEASLPRPKSFYSAHKYLAERYLEYSGLPYAIARLANVYGPRQRTDQEGGVVAIVIDRLQAREPVVIYGDGEQFRDFVHVADVVRAVEAMLLSDADGLWNVSTGRRTTINQLLVAAEEIYGPAVAVERLPTRVGDVFGSWLGNDLIARDLSWTPTIDLKQGLRSMKGPSGTH